MLTRICCTQLLNALIILLNGKPIAFFSSRINYELKQGI
jgi:hypothetical protein